MSKDTEPAADNNAGENLIAGSVPSEDASTVASAAPTTMGNYLRYFN